MCQKCCRAAALTSATSTIQEMLTSSGCPSASAAARTRTLVTPGEEPIPTSARIPAIAASCCATASPGSRRRRRRCRGSRSGPDAGVEHGGTGAVVGAGELATRRARVSSRSAVGSSSRSTVVVCTPSRSRSHTRSGRQARSAASHVPITLPRAAASNIALACRPPPPMTMTSQGRWPWVSGVRDTGAPPSLSGLCRPSRRRRRSASGQTGRRAQNGHPPLEQPVCTSPT